ncbi:MAG TPA: hypothetical protein VK886_05930 [Vicinamibacterales bacterium]|nr:hypothetical protein [Vicinamibacterales bacterium]
MRPRRYAVLAAVLALAFAPGASSQAPLSDAQVEQFLKTARVGKTRTTGKGITASTRATLSDGALTHDAHIQTIDERKGVFESRDGVEFNFRDSWVFNVAAYRLDRLLGLNLVPVSVSRRWRAAPGAFTWWVDDVMMDEGERLKKGLRSPDSARWNRQMQMVRLFDQLIANTDRNIGNVLITSDWRIWAIDHTRAFRTQKTLKSPKNITSCDRQVFERLKQLDQPTIEREMGEMLSPDEINALLARRDAILARLAELGPAAIFERSEVTK